MSQLNEISFCLEPKRSREREKSKVRSFGQEISTALESGLTIKTRENRRRRRRKIVWSQFEC